MLESRISPDSLSEYYTPAPKRHIIGMMQALKRRGVELSCVNPEFSMQNCDKPVHLFENKSSGSALPAKQGRISDPIN